MKIISKFKDYYDFHQGEFGIDPLKVLDRSEYFPLRTFEEFNNKYLFFCGKWYFRGKAENIKYHNFHKRHFDENFRFIDINILHKDEFIYWAEITNYDEIEKRLWNPDTIKIFQKSTKAYFVYSYWDIPSGKIKPGTYFPNLKEIGFDKVFNSKDCYLMIEAFISKKDLEVNTNPSDMNLFEQKGFDKKSSFRNKK